MRRTTYLASAALLALAAAPAAAQRGMGPAMPRYDTTTVQTITGTVVRVDTIRAMTGMRGAGVHLALRVGSDTVPVHLGPATYLAGQPVSFAAGDQVTVRGSRVVWQEKPAVLAAEVKKGNATLTLRDAQGLPRWRGAGMRGPGMRMP